MKLIAIFYADGKSETERKIAGYTKSPNDMVLMKYIPEWLEKYPRGKVEIIVI